MLASYIHHFYYINLCCRTICFAKVLVEYHESRRVITLSAKDGANGNVNSTTNLIKTLFLQENLGFTLLKSVPACRALSSFGRGLTRKYAPCMWGIILIWFCSGKSG